ncbi:MAG: CBS domain-containing protein [Flavobacteriaceae bacterium]
MKVSDAMTKDVKIANPRQTLQEAAGIMAQIDAGALPVGDNDRLVGMITDRDMAIRAIAQGKGPDCTVGEIMSEDIHYCYDDETVDEVCQNLGDQQIRRIPVVNRDKRLVGILSLGDLALKDGGSAGQALSGISRPGGAHSQSGHAHM